MGRTLRFGTFDAWEISLHDFFFLGCVALETPVGFIADGIISLFCFTP